MEVRSAAEDGESRWTYRSLRRGFLTPELVSGTVLVSVVIAVADETGGIQDVFIVTVLSMIVFWATQVFVITVASQRRRAENESVQLTHSLSFAVSTSNGLLLAGAPPLIFLIVGLFGIYQGQVAYWVALWTEVFILAVLGWIAFADRGIAWYWQACGALSTAAFGLLAVTLKILVS